MTWVRVPDLVALWRGHRHAPEDCRSRFNDHVERLMLFAHSGIKIPPGEAKPLLDYLTTICDRTVVDWEITQ